jgi:hypothetical protein
MYWYSSINCALILALAGMLFPAPRASAKEPPDFLKKINFDQGQAKLPPGYLAHLNNVDVDLKVVGYFSSIYLEEKSRYRHIRNPGEITSRFQQGIAR